MNSFNNMGEAMLLAAEGQQQIARALLAALGRGITRMMDRFGLGMANSSARQD
jgi:hypothetical protein